MAKVVFWRSDWFVGGVLTLLMLLLGSSGPMQGLERAAYDLGLRATSRTPSAQLAVIAIDDQSIASLGDWPWSRELHARMTDLLAGAQVKVIGNTIGFSAPQLDPGYRYISRLIDVVTQSVADGVVPSPEVEKISLLLAEAETVLNADQKLLASYARAGNVVLPIGFEPGEAGRQPNQPLPGFVAKNRLGQIVKGGGSALPVGKVQAPFVTLGEKALAAGFQRNAFENAGNVRAEPLVVQYQDQFYPSLALVLAAKSLGIELNDIRVHLGQAIQLGKRHLPIDAANRIHPLFYRGKAGQPAFPVDSFADVLSGKVPASKYAGKTVLIGISAASLAPLQATPVSSSMPAVLRLAHVVSSILEGDVIATPGWARWASWGAVVFIGLYLMLVLPQMSAMLGLAASGALLAGLVGANFGLLLGAATWVPLMGAASLLIVGHLVLTAKHRLQTAPGSGTADLHSAESNLMLGLALQGQGKLDLAFDKFCKCPMSDGLMETMYNLALDCERKQLFKKAEEIFRTMADFNPKFRDLKLRLALSKQAAETGGQRTGHPPAEKAMPAKHDGPREKPMLGRYQLEKEIGKGAMGVVYLGRDAKIGRVAAIKTMALAQSFDESDLADVKQRFFREAETAGRLNHPNIVTIYEAGEERDLAYIAMEFLKGRDLEPMSKPGALLPLPRLLSIAARVADALDYAHSQQVIHRDIKPANIMYEAERDVVKVTDFGIARITDSSRTKTGMVLGTPSYMSPEQLLGKKIDGRSDLFSLGVMLYQMSCGQLPFVGDSLAQLMSKITREAPTDPLSINPSLPAGLVAVLNKALSKSPEGRYQRGAEMAADLRACLDKGST